MKQCGGEGSVKGGFSVHKMRKDANVAFNKKYPESGIEYLVWGIYVCVDIFEALRTLYFKTLLSG